MSCFCLGEGFDNVGEQCIGLQTVVHVIHTMHFAQQPYAPLSCLVMKLDDESYDILANAACCHGYGLLYLRRALRAFDMNLLRECLVMSSAKKRALFVVLTVGLLSISLGCGN